MKKVLLTFGRGFDRFWSNSGPNSIKFDRFGSVQFSQFF